MSMVIKLMGDHPMKIICPDCGGNGFVWVTPPTGKVDRWQTDCTRCKNQGELDINEENMKDFHQ